VNPLQVIQSGLLDGIDHGHAGLVRRKTIDVEDGVDEAPGVGERHLKATSTCRTGVLDVHVRPAGRLRLARLQRGRHSSEDGV
jgi:hypothetical protein